MYKNSYFKIVILFLLLSNLYGEYIFDTDCYLNFSDAIDVKSNLEYKAIIPNIKIPNYLYNYKNLQTKLYANFYLTFDNNDPFFQTKDSLFLVIPSIGSVDMTYLNGKLIGQTGKFPPYYQPEFCKERIYYIPPSLISSKNILRILVYSSDKNGGILQDVPKIYSIKELKDVKNSLSSPWQSVLLPFSNGLSVANFDKINVHFNNFYPTIYSNYNSNEKSKLVLPKLTPVIYQNDILVDLKTKKSKTNYIFGTGIIEHKLQIDNCDISILGFCPFAENESLWIFYIIFENGNFNSFQGDFELDKMDPNLKIHKDAFISDNKKWTRLIIEYPRYESSDFSLTKYKNINTNFSIFTNELKWWKNWQDTENIPTNITEDQMQFYIQSLVLLKMSQCREDFPLRGQIVSSLPPGNNRVNLLDQSLAIESLILSKHYSEALSCLQFLLHGRCGNYKDYNLYGNNVGLLNPYCLSINDYYSNGTEKEINPDEPVISLAGYGLILSNIRHYVEETKDNQFIEYYWEKIYKEIAHVVINLIDENGLIRTDSGFFEDPLPGAHYTYTSVLIYNGLIDVAWLARLMAQETAAQELEFYANTIRLGIQNLLYDKRSQIMRSALEGRTLDKYIDASISSVVNYLFTSQDNISKLTIKTIEKYLSNKTNPLVYSKYSYNFIDRNYSTFLNLNLAESYYKMNENQKGDDIINYLIDLSKSNSSLLPCNINPIFNNYSGCISTKSHSAYIKAIHFKK